MTQQHPFILPFELSRNTNWSTLGSFSWSTSFCRFFMDVVPGGAKGKDVMAGASAGVRDSGMEEVVV